MRLNLPALLNGHDMVAIRLPPPIPKATTGTRQTRSTRKNFHGILTKDGMKERPITIPSQERFLIITVVILQTPNVGLRAACLLRGLAPGPPRSQKRIRLLQLSHTGSIVVSVQCSSQSFGVSSALLGDAISASSAPLSMRKSRRAKPRVLIFWHRSFPLKPNVLLKHGKTIVLIT